MESYGSVSPTHPQARCLVVIKLQALSLSLSLPLSLPSLPLSLAVMQVHGEKCHFPYDCSDGLSVDSTELMTCKTDKKPAKFFGAHKLGAELGHMGGLFFEFLQVEL